jgi:hypothetical protein
MSGKSRRRPTKVASVRSSSHDYRVRPVRRNGALPVSTRDTKLVADRLRFGIRHAERDLVQLDLSSARVALQGLESAPDLAEKIRDRLRNPCTRDAILLDLDSASVLLQRLEEPT